MSPRDRLYLASELPTVFVWGEWDRIIPPDHGREAQGDVPGSRLELLSDSGHFPQLDEPEAFVEVLTKFVSSTEAASVSAAAMRATSSARAPVTEDQLAPPRREAVTRAHARVGVSQTSQNASRDDRNPIAERHRSLSKPLHNGEFALDRRSSRKPLWA